jgi:hypothetical protein
MEQPTPPILFLIFNRPDLTAEVFSRIREAAPSQLFVAADGPRAAHPEDEKLCQQARDVATRVDWDCEVYTLFRDENLGLKEAVSSAITWFFQHVESGVILEDDCVPHPTFFPYCGKLLDRYADDERIVTIGSNNFQPSSKQYGCSYYYSAYMHCWGWATWRRAWNLYRGDIPEWPELRSSGWLKGWLGSNAEQEYWTAIFDKVFEGEIDSWAYPWTFACWREHGLNVVPSVNLVSNVGFDDRATHTKNPEADAANLQTEPFSFPIKHPQSTVRDYTADRYTSKHHFGIERNDHTWRSLIREQVPEKVRRAIRPVLRGLGL